MFMPINIAFPICITLMSQVKIFYPPTGSLTIIEFDNIVRETL